MARISRASPKLLLLVTLFALLLLAACGPQGNKRFGLLAVSPDGSEAAIIEYHAGVGQLLALDLATGKTRVLQDNVDPYQISASFSPNGRYLIINSTSRQSLLDARWMVTTTLAVSNTKVSFLPNGKLLATDRNDELRFTVVDPSDPASGPKTVVADHIQHLFSKEVPESYVGDPCAIVQPEPDRKTWIFVGADMSVSRLTADARDVSLHPVEPAIGGQLTRLIEVQQEAFRAKLIEKRGALVATATQQAALGTPTPEGTPPMTEEEFNRSLDLIAYSDVKGWITGNVLGLPAPDGTRLLFLDTRIAQDDSTLFTLYLVTLDAASPPIQLTDTASALPRFTFSPDSRQILFEGVRDGKPGVFLADGSGSSVQPLPLGDVSWVCWY